MKTYIIWFTIDIQKKMSIRFTHDKKHIKFTANWDYIVPLSPFVSPDLTSEISDVLPQ